MSVTKKRQFHVASVAQTVRYNDINIAGIEITDYTDSKYAPSQKYAYMNYNCTPLHIQSPYIRLIAYGIPKHDAKYHNTVKDRIYS